MEIDRLNNAIAMTLDLLQKRHGSASYCEDVDAAERFLKAQYRSREAPQSSRCEPDHSNVINAEIVTVQDIPAERVVSSAAKASLAQVVIVGLEQDGEFYFASSQGSNAETNYLLQKGIHQLHRDCEDIDQLHRDCD